MKDENTKVINLEKKTVVPGFNDSHMHLVNFANSLRIIPLANCKSIDDLIDLGKDYLKIHPDHKGWIIGRGWNQDNFREKRFPTRYDLDKISTEFPICYIRVCCHALVVNSKALEIANINNTSTQIDGGYFDLDENNNPLGIFRIETPS
ncbi:MAG: amidohydrolase family protein [Anaeromicrobium sp.]|uniref:amidohydrolase family protein n=1 Tax=Anaeromicrobium sp. TaxID=1929132 RepID=UPI0025F6446D|nr:amidohydrolase family protein [Anaeromicrobium sp.]MCT4595133.1 amidohydrolase family protein [Anaeromicrobium sp.]